MSQQTQSTFEIRHAFQVLWRRKLVIIETLVVLPAVVLAFSLSQPESYQATARVMVESQSPTFNAATGQNLGTQKVDDRQVATLASFVDTPEVAQRVKANLAWPDSVDQLMDDVASVPVTDANVIAVTAHRPTAADSAELAIAFAEQFVEWRRETQQSALGSAINLTDRQIAAARVGTADYQELIARRNQLEVIKALTAGDVTLGQKAQTPTSPAAPRPLRNTALAFGAALILGIGIAFLREAVDVRVHSLEELEQLTSRPIISIIDELPKEFRRRGRLITLEDPRNPVSESYRLLRTNLEFMNFSHDLKAVLITSPLPSQGKSTTISNLAVVLVRAGKRVAVVECDLRRPTLHSYFKVQNTKGLTSVISGLVPLEEALHVLSIRDETRAVTTQSGRESIDETGGRPQDAGRQISLLTSGPVPPNPGEIVTSQQLTQIIDTLKENHDYVLVDAPPMLAVGDAAAIAGKVDGVIVIVRLEETSRRTVTEIDTFFERVPARPLGLVVAGVSRMKRDGYRYSGYY